MNLSRQDKDLLLEIVRDALAGEPAELEVFTLTGEEVLMEATSRRRIRDADSDAFFGGLDHSLGEFLMHLLVLAAAEAIKSGYDLSRERLRKILAERRLQWNAMKNPEFERAEELLILCLIQKTEPCENEEYGRAD